MRPATARLRLHTRGIGMAIYQITTANSVLTTADYEIAFRSDSPGFDTLVVDAGAYLKTEGTDAYGAYLARTMGWSVQVNGLIRAEESIGLYLDLQTVASLVSVGLGGEIYGGDIACYNPSNLVNAGLIYGAHGGILAGGAFAQTIRNSGTIYGRDYSFFGSAYADTVTNTGFFEGNVSFQGGNDQFTNAGTIFDDVLMGEGDDTITTLASGVFGSDVDLGEGHDTVTNSGLMSATIFSGAGNDRITNKGTITYDVFLGSGFNSLTNSKNIYGYVFGGGEKDIVKNTGVIEGVIDLGGGDDSFTGGNRTEIVVDGAASDIVKLGGGDDFYFSIGNFNQAEDGVDIIDGGAGFDSINAASAIDSVYINLDSKAHDFSPFLPGVGLIAGNTATGIGLSVDSIRNFEAVVCGAGSDIVYGNATGNLLVGGGGFDTLAGFGGNDVLIGGDGGDALWGGIGRDYLTGGAGVDYFQFAAIAESKVSPAGRDAIMDFESGIDFIDLRPIDANTKAGKADDAFTFIGAANFSKTPGELRIWAPAGMQIVEGDVNGDGKADFSIDVVTTAATLQLTASDFLL
jgi:hypothetical protein